MKNITELLKERNPYHMPPLVTDNPTSNYAALLNFAYAKDGEVYLRYVNGEHDVNLAEYICHLAAEKGCGTHTKEDVLNGDICFVCDCEVAVLNVVAVQAAEMRERLRKFEEAEK